MCAALVFQSLVVRHDVADEKHIALAQKYPQVCHFAMGEGTLVDSLWILTAAHVGADLKKDLDAGMNPAVSCNGNTYKIEAVFIYPGFKPIEERLAHDLALVRIESPVKGIVPPKIYTDKDEKGQQVILVGMGDFGTGLTGPVKRDKITRAATNRIDGADESWISFTFDSAGAKNATELEGISGPGDSGGPALVEKNGKTYIAGISSHQEGQAKYGKGRYGVTEYYTRVSRYAGWIGETISSYKKTNPVTVANTNPEPGELKEYAGVYGFRKIILKNGRLFFQRENEPLIPMKKLGKDEFIWDDNGTRIVFRRDGKNAITGFDIVRKNGEVVKAEKSKE